MSLRDIINYTGEGCKPIFEREEIKKAVNEVEEQRTVVAIDGEHSGIYYYLILFNKIEGRFTFFFFSKCAKLKQMK